jgi:hypothetical protein
VFDLFTHGAIDSLPDYADVAVRGEILFPVAGPIREDPWCDYSTVDVRWERFAYQQFTSGIMFKEPDHRQHIAKMVRYALAEHIALHWTINLHAVLHPWRGD